MEKFIRYKDHIILYSNDNWKTIESLKELSKSAIEEKNPDITTKVKLRYLLGEKRGKIIIEELEKIRGQFNLQKNDGYGTAFEVFSIAVLHDIDYDLTMDNYIVNGNQDGKIDAIYWNNLEENILYQVKIDTLDPKEINIVDVMSNNYRSYVKTGKIQSPETDDLFRFCEKNKEHLTKNKNMRIKIISNNDLDDEINIKPIEIFNLYFYNILIRRQNNIELSLSIPLKQNVANIVGRKDIYAYFVDAKTFVEDLLKCEKIGNSENLYKFFYDNVRGKLGSNNSIQATIDDEPNNFVKYNNGVTITGEVEYLEGTVSIKVTNPVINNGQQTIWNIMNRYPNIENVSLLVIVKDGKNVDVKSKISKYTNSQRNIKPIDLLSLDEKLRCLQENIFKLTLDNDALFLDINFSGARNYHSILKRMYSKYQVIALDDFCKLYFGVSDLELGSWKNTISSQLNKIVDKSDEYDVEKALLVCRTISKVKEYIANINDKGKKNDLNSAELALMYIVYKYRVSLDRAVDVINHINNKYYYSIPDDERISKLIDLYKSNTIIKKIEEAIIEMKIEKAV